MSVPYTEVSWAGPGNESTSIRLFSNACTYTKHSKDTTIESKDREQVSEGKQNYVKTFVC